MSSIRSARFLAASTSLRILLTPVIMALLLADVDPVLTAALFAFAAATDWVDGYLARRWDVTTKLGSFLDTTADKLLVTGVLIALVAVERASPWVSLIIIGRELMVLGLRGVIAAAVEAANAHGRWVGVCGELAGDPEAAVILAGLGVRELSMAAGRIPAVKDALRAVSRDDARAAAQRALG